MRLLAILLTLLSVALFTPAQGSDVDSIPQAPDLRPIEKYLSNRETLFLPTPPAAAWAFFRDTPITDFLEPTDRIPAIVSIDVLTGPWGVPGSVRRVLLEDGGAVLERVIDSTDTAFTYQIWDIQTGSGRFIDHIFGEFRVQEVPGGSEISWTYNIAPSVFFARPFVRRFLKNDFAPFMQGGMAGLEAAFASQN